MRLRRLSPVPRAVAAVLAALGLVPGCGEDEVEPPLELQVVRWVEPGGLEPVPPGGEVPLALAPQGGHFVFVAARVRGLSSDRVRMNATLRDEATDTAISAAVARPAMAQAGDGWWDPEHETFTTLDMVQVCPRGVGLDLDGRGVVLAVTVVEISTGREGTIEQVIRPVCAGDDAAFCTCECAAGYVPGGC